MPEKSRFRDSDVYVSGLTPPGSGGRFALDGFCVVWRTVGTVSARSPWLGGPKSMARWDTLAFNA